ncbi:MAG: S1 RNA-binding domain-containing protein, partial [Patescibacteria group bacterium]
NFSSSILQSKMENGNNKELTSKAVKQITGKDIEVVCNVSGKENETAIQMDIKLKGLPREILVKALAQSKVGRQHILQEMLKCIDKPRTELSAHAPKIEQITIPTDKIGELIGPGGKMIKEIIAKSGAQVDVEEDKDKEIGLVFISSSDQAEIDAASTMVNNLTRVVEVGDEFDGKVVRIEAYGAFVEYLPGRDGLVHVSAMSTDYVSDPSTLVKLGDEVHVRVAEIKEDGKIGLSMLTPEQETEAKNNASARGARPRTPFRGSRNSGGDRNGRGGYGGGRNSGGSRGSSRGGYSGNRGQSRGGRRDDNRKPAFKSQMTSE